MQQFEYDWRIFLAKYNVPYFHMKEFSQSKGPFKKWKDLEGTRRNFMRDAAEIIGETIQHGWVGFVDHESFEKVDGDYALRESFKSPYALAGRTVEEFSNQWRRKETHESEMECIFEDGGPDRDGLVKAMRVLLPHLPIPSFKPSRDVKPCPEWPDGRKAVVQLQAADYLAYEIRKFVSDHPKLKTGERKFRTSLGILPAKKVTRVFIDYTRLVNVCEVGQFKRRALESPRP